MKILDLKDSHRYNLQFDVDGQFVKRTDNHYLLRNVKICLKQSLTLLETNGQEQRRRCLHKANVRSPQY